MFDLVLEILRKRPVGHVEKLADSIEPAIDHQQHDIGMIADISQPAGMLDHIIKQITMDNPKPVTIDACMDGIIHYLNFTETQPQKLAGHFIMVTGDIDDLCSATRLAEQFLDNIIMLLRPIPALFQLPAINHVTDKIHGFTFGMLDEMENLACTGPVSAQMRIGNPDCPESEGLIFAHLDRRRIHESIITTRMLRTRYSNIAVSFHLLKTAQNFHKL